MGLRAAGLVTLITVGGALLLWGSPGPVRPPESVDSTVPQPPAAPQPLAPTAALPAQSAVAPPPPAVAVDRQRQLLLPDGTYVPALNGAEDAEPIATYWGPFPWSPIVGIETNSQGLDWYKHKDGSYSTTQMVWREDLGKKMAMTRVAHPAPGETPKVAPAAASPTGNK